MVDTGKPMELLAAGFNAWGQLCLEDPPVAACSAAEPDDLYGFVKVLRSERIELPVSRLAYTIVQTDRGILSAGVLPNNDAPTLCSVISHLRGEASNGDVLIVEQGSPVSRDEHDNIAESRARHSLTLHPGLPETGITSKTFQFDSAIAQVAAYEVGFVILFENGQVATFGDARFPDCLGRDVTEARQVSQLAKMTTPGSTSPRIALPQLYLQASAPADRPSTVTDLATGLVVDDGKNDDPVQHITAAGYTAAALTRSGSLYVWGMPSPGSRQQQHAASPFAGLSGTPNYVEVAGGKDVRDVAVGESHAVALTTDGEVYVIGGNENGQLGLGEGFRGRRAEEWTRVERRVWGGESGRRSVIGVAAGPRTSFILTSAEITH